MTAVRCLDHRIAGLFARYDSLGDLEASPFTPTPECRAGIAAEKDAVRREVEVALGKASCPVEVLLLRHWGELLDLIEARLQSDQAFPHRFVIPIAGRIQAMVDLDTRPAEVKAAMAASLLEATLPVLDAVVELAARVPEARRQMTLHALDGLAAYLDGAEPHLGVKLAPAPERAREHLTRRVRDVRAGVLDAASRIRSAPLPGSGDMTRDLPYVDTLRLVFGIDLDDLLSWYREEVDRRAGELRTLAAALDPRRTAFDILEQDLGPYDDPDAMYRAMEAYVDLARQRALEHVSLPDGETCDVWRVPGYLRDAYPWGGYFSRGNTLLGQLRGAVFLNHHNYRTVTRGWVQLNAIHECYPGHHAHYVKTVAGDLPLSFKVGATLMSRCAPLSEALSMRTETLLQDIFDEPAFPLFAVYRRLHTAVRVWADLLLHHFRLPSAAAVELYAKHLQFTRPVARGQVYAQELTPGYFTTYYYGLKRIGELETRCGWRERDFSELVFSCGKVSLSTVEKLIGLEPADRDRLLRGFSSWPAGPAAPSGSPGPSARPKPESEGGAG